MVSADPRGVAPLPDGGRHILRMSNKLKCARCGKEVREFANDRRCLCVACVRAERKGIQEWLHNKDRLLSSRETLHNQITKKTEVDDEELTPVEVTPIIPEDAIKNLKKHKPMDTKRCKVCERELPLEEFSRHAMTKDGLHTTCKACMKKSRDAGQLAEAQRRVLQVKPEALRKSAAEVTRSMFTEKSKCNVGK